jgi:hypothetical protein
MTGGCGTLGHQTSRMADISDRAFPPAREGTPLNQFFSGDRGERDSAAPSNPNAMVYILMTMSVVLGLIPAIVCLVIYYTNGGASAVCSQPLPSWLFWMGYISAAHALLPMATIPLVLCLSESSRDAIRELAKFMGGALNLFLIIWFAVGCVEVFSTDVSQCDTGMYNATKVYVMVSLMFFPLLICCGCWLLYSVANDADRASEEELLRKRAASRSVSPPVRTSGDPVIY